MSDADERGAKAHDTQPSASAASAGAAGGRHRLDRPAASG